MDYEMTLDEGSFFKIKSGEKIFEGRLFDFKRRKLEVDDVIRFYRRVNQEYFFDVKIIKLRRYNFFEDMFSDLGGKVFGCEDSCLVEDFVSIYRKYYSEDKEKAFGVLGIMVEVLK